MLLTAVGPLLAWRKNLRRKPETEFPASRHWFGCRRRHDDRARRASLGRSFVLLRGHGRRSLGAGDLHRHFEFVREVASSPARAIRICSRHDSPLPRNTRRYGGYIVHFGVALVVIGILGTPSIKKLKKRWASATAHHRSLHPGLPVLHARRQSQLRQRVGDHQRIPRRQADHDYVPERRFYKASGQPQTSPASIPASAKISSW